MPRLVTVTLIAGLAAGSAAAQGRPSGNDRPLVVRGTLASSAEGAFETGRLTSPEDFVAGPFVLTYVGGALEVVSAAGGQVLGLVSQPIAGTFLLAPGTFLRPRGKDAVIYSGIRPMPVTRALEGYVGRPIWMSVGGAQPEQWTLRDIGADHVTVERSRSFRAIALRRIAEIAWTNLTGADPTPRVVLTHE